MITEDYVTLETAKLLKEKGFNEKCRYVYKPNGERIPSAAFMEGEPFVNNEDIEKVAWYVDGWNVNTQGDYAFLCPTIHMATKWLRLNHSINPDAVPCTDNDGLFTTKFNSYVEKLKGKGVESPFVGTFESYEMALEEAIIYALKVLMPY